MFEKIIAFFMVIINFFMGLFGLGGGTDSQPQYDCQQFYNVAYGTHERQVVDFFIPNDASGDLGMVLFIHGGAWMAGDKESYDAGSIYCATGLDIAGATLNYRYISEDVSILDILDDIDAALAVIKEKGNELGVNINKVLLTGDSAGGHLSMLYAYARKNTAPIAPVAVVSNSGPTDLYDDNFYHNNTLGNEAVMSDLFSKACGQKFTYDTKENAKEALLKVSPIYYVNENTVPTIINHGEKDSIVPYSNALSIVEKFEQYSVEYDFVSYPNSNHDLGNDPDCSDKTNDLLFEYVAKYLG